MRVKATTLENSCLHSSYFERIHPHHVEVVIEKKNSFKNCKITKQKAIEKINIELGVVSFSLFLRTYGNFSLSYYHNKRFKASFDKLQCNVMKETYKCEMPMLQGPVSD